MIARPSPSLSLDRDPESPRPSARRQRAFALRPRRQAPTRVYLTCPPLRAREGADGQAVVCAELRGRSPTRSVAPKPHRGARVNLSCHPLRAREGADGQAVVCPLLRGSSPTRGVAPKQHRGLRRAFSPAFRAGSLYPLARGCRRSWRGEIWFRPARCCSTGSGRLDLDLMIRGPAFT